MKLNPVAADYIHLRSYMRDAMNASVATRPDEPGWVGVDDDTRQGARRLLAPLLDARVFDCTGLVDVIADTQRYVYGTVAGIPWKKDGVAGHPAKADRLHEASSDVPLPEHLPFEAVWLGWQWRMSPVDLQVRFRPDSASYPELMQTVQLGDRLGTDPRQVLYARVTSRGVLLTRAGLCIELVHAERRLAGQPEAWYSAVWHYDSGRPDGARWECPISAMPWIVYAMIGVINEHRTLVLEARPGYGERREIRKLRKQLKDPTIRPQPYYTVQLTDKVVIRHPETGRANDGVRRRYQDFRSDVRGHERVYCRRGMLPLKPDQRAWLEKHDYRVYERGPVEEEDIERMCLRGLPRKRPGEWVAVKHKWVRDYIKGSEGAPYIPKTRAVAPPVEVV